MRRLLLLMILILGLAATAKAQEPGTFVPVNVDATGVLSAEAVTAFVKAVLAEDAQPTNIAVLVHGFDVPREESARQYGLVSGLLKDEYARSKQKVLVVGLQWDSDVDVGLLDLTEAYLGKVPVARSTGRQALRQVLLALQQRFPKAGVHLMAHSMGCEVSAAAVVPEMKYKEGEAPVAEPYAPQKAVELDLIVLAGSDLDYDAFAKGDIQPSQEPRLRMLWVTMSPVMGDKDEVLKLRKVVRGKAGGNTFPLMTQHQYDTIFANKALFVDNEDIPKSHDLLLYYDAARIAQLAPAQLWLANPKASPQPAAFAELDAVLKTQDNAKELARWLDSPNLSSQMYALWRLEKLLCGGSQHLADEFLPNLGYMLRHTPRKVLTVRNSPDCECVTVKSGYWPTARQMTAAGCPPWAAP